jgi:hypothetical protein
MTTPQPPQPPSQPEPLVETDPRFPSGPWRGFFLMDHWPGRHQMELHLTFRQAVMTGEGRDRIGTFLIRGKYNLDDGKCYWTKRYIGKHDVAYQGYNEGKGIWGLWEIPPSSRGGFHIWPTAMGDPTSPHLAEAIDEPAESPIDPLVAPEVEVEVGAGVGAAEAEPVGAPADTGFQCSVRTDDSKRIHLPSRAQARREDRVVSPRSQFRRSSAKAWQSS